MFSGAKKLSYCEPADGLRIVSEPDGTEIEGNESTTTWRSCRVLYLSSTFFTKLSSTDDEYFQLIPQFPATFMLLRNSEHWTPNKGSTSAVCDELCHHRCSQGWLLLVLDDQPFSGYLRYSVTIPLFFAGANGQSSDAVDSANIPGLSDRAVYLFGQLCTEGAYKQLLPWLLLRPTDLEVSLCSS